MLYFLRQRILRCAQPGEQDCSSKATIASKVIETRGGEDKEFPRWSEIKAAQEMYEEGMEWWDAGAGM